MNNDIIGLNPQSDHFQTYLEEYINTHVNKSQLTNLLGYRFFAWSSLFLTIFYIFLVPFLNEYKREWLLDNVALIVILFVAFIVMVIVAFSLLKNKNNSNRQILFNGLPITIYQDYFEKAFPNSPLKFEGLRESKLYPSFNSLVFSINGEEINWNIREHEETRTRTDSKGNTTTYTVYFLEYALILNSQRLTNYYDITLTQRKIHKASKQPADNEFVSASMNFNKKFKVITNAPDKMQVTRLFDPSVIEYFDHLESLESPINRWNITNGKAYVTWSSGQKSKPWGANLYRFEYFRFTPKNYVEKVTQRLETDFQRFFITFHQFRPFDFYHLYSHLK